MKTREENPVEQDHDFTVFRHKVMITVTVVAVVGILLAILISTMNIIPLIFISLLIAVILRSLSNPIANHTPIPHRWAVILAALLLVGSIVTFFVLTGPSVVRQFSELQEQIPDAIETIEQDLRQYDWGATLLESIGQIPEQGGNLNIFSRVTGFFSNAFSLLTTVLLIIVAGVYMAFEPKLYTENFVRLFPLHRRERMKEVLDESYEILRSWLIARGLSMVVVGVLTLIGLIIIDMPLVLTLSIIAALLSFIPNIGPILAAVPAILVGLTQSLFMGLLVAGVYSLVQQIENYLITPVIERQTVQLPPALVMLSQVFLTILFGWLGLFIAAPLVAVSIVIVKSFYVEDFLGDDVGKITES